MKPDTSSTQRIYQKDLRIKTTPQQLAKAILKGGASRMEEFNKQAKTAKVG